MKQPYKCRMQKRRKSEDRQQARNSSRQEKHRATRQTDRTDRVQEKGKTKRSIQTRAKQTQSPRKGGILKGSYKLDRHKAERQRQSPRKEENLRSIQIRANQTQSPRKGKIRKGTYKLDRRLFCPSTPRHCRIASANPVTQRALIDASGETESSAINQQKSDEKVPSYAVRMRVEQLINRKVTRKHPSDTQ
jgi:hypothetical protein